MMINRHPRATSTLFYPVFFDTFENGNLNKWPTTGLTPEIVDNPSGSGHVCKINADGEYIKKTLATPLTKSIALRVDARTNTNSWWDVNSHDSSGRYLFDVQFFPTTKKLKWTDGGSWYDIVDYSDDTWYTLRLTNFDFTAHTFKITINGGSDATIGFRNVAANNFNDLQIGMFNAGGTDYVDNVALYGRP